MKPIIIACETIERELLAAMEALSCPYEILWLESGLHNVPKKLKARLQELLDDCQDYDTVLLAMSFCGNSVVGLHTHSFRLVIPRCDDCITLLLGSPERRMSVSGTYFLTEGWLKGERNIWVEYEQCLKRYGEEQGKWIFSELLAHYKQIALVNTGAFDAEKAAEESKFIAQRLGLAYTELEGTLDHIKELLRGNWSPDRFAIIEPDSVVTQNDCTL